tara:strand:- start:689 stop:856 length:168 start_codon:yes stop_codon:yes gene_type:complete
MILRGDADVVSSLASETQLGVALSGIKIVSQRTAIASQQAKVRFIAPESVECRVG